MSHSSRIVLCAAAGALFSALAIAQPAVWMTDAMVKVQPNATPGGASSISLYAARNEFESFQVHIQAGASPIQLNVTASDLFNSQVNQSISAASNIAIFREAYQNITTPSDLNGVTGLVPDALIPVTDAYLHEPRNAFPFTVPAGQTQSVWVDVFVPPGTTAGSYTGAITVYDSATAIAVLPVQLTVWNFMLPSMASLRSSIAINLNTLGQFAYGNDANTANYPGANGNEEAGIDLIRAAITEMFLDHRMSIGIYHSGVFPGGQWSLYDSIFGPVQNGTANTILQGAQVTSVYYPNYGLPNANVPDITDYINHYTANQWLPKLYLQVCDEPPNAGCSFATLATGAQQLKSLFPNLPLLVTTSIDRATTNNVLQYLDILAPVVDFVQPQGLPSTRPSYDSWLQNPGKQLWWYQSCDEHESCANGTPGPITSTWPSYMIDASPMRNRIFQWMAYLYGIQGELYYLADNWGSDPWHNLYTSGGNGEGALFYPGTAAIIGGTDPVPVASLRLKLIRDGEEDFEYLKALNDIGMSSVAQSAANAFITNAYTFSSDPTQLQSARITLGNALNQASLQTPPFSISSVSPPLVAGGSDTTLTVNGANFAAGDTIRWSSPSSGGEIALTTTFVNSGQLTAALSHTLFAAAGTARITVRRNATQAAVTSTVIAPNAPTSLGASIQGKSGPTNARVWNIQFTNNGPGLATGVQMTGFTLAQTFGTGCTPVVGALPSPIASIAANASAAAPITINFSSCTGTVRFRVTMPFSANGGTVTGTMTSNNQTP